MFKQSQKRVKNSVYNRFRMCARAKFSLNLICNRLSLEGPLHERQKHSQQTSLSFHSCAKSSKHTRKCRFLFPRIPHSQLWLNLAAKPNQCEKQ